MTGPGVHEYDVVVAGCGIAGLAAAVSACEAGARVVVLERAPREERGGNTRYTEAYLRMKSETEVSDDFEAHFAANAGYHLDPGLVAETAADYANWPAIVKTLAFSDPELVSTFAREAGPTIGWLKRFGVRFDFLPTYFITMAQPRMMPVGGGLALVEALAGWAEDAGVEFHYETTARTLVQDADGRVVGLRATSGDHGDVEFRAPSVVLACGGFEGNAEMMVRYVGPKAGRVRPIARGGYYNRGEGIEMALAIGAAPAGDFASYHAEPIDPRSGAAEANVMVFNYGVLVNAEARRFVDEAPATVDATYDAITREIFAQREGIAWTILDAGLDDVPGWHRAVRSDQPPITADTIEALGAKLGLDGERLAATVAEYNAACPDPAGFRPLEPDGLRTRDLWPPKSNWARRLDRPPYRAWPMIAGNVLTYGGLKVDSDARVLDGDGRPIPGLYAGGEVIGLYYGVYTGATSVLRGAVFGRLGGRHAATRKGVGDK